MTLREGCFVFSVALLSAPAGAQEAPPAADHPAPPTTRPEAAVPQGAPAGSGAAPPPSVASAPAPVPPVSSAAVRAAPITPPAPPPVVALVPAPPPTDATVHIAIDYAGAWLEGRSRVDLGLWRRLCAAPCDGPVRVEGLEFRVVAPDMTPSNRFAIDPGAGTARLRVSGGSSSARNFGIIALAGGLPVTFAGMTLFGLGSLQDSQGERTAGLIALGVGGAAIAVALPLLLLGSTTVKDEHGRYIARTRNWFTF